MSLINDALKRASQAEKNRPRETGLPPAMQAVAEPRRSNMPIVIITCVVVLLAVAGVLVWHSFSKSEASAQAPAPVPVVPHPIAPTPPPKVEQVVTPVPSPTPTPQPVVATLPPETNSPTPPPQPMAITPPPQPQVNFPDLKLQGVLYNTRNPRATINGSLKREGEQIDGVTIVKINQNSVTVGLNGQTKDLFLNGQ